MSKNNVFYKLPAQILLQDKSVTFSGFLERKIKFLAFKPWIKCYTVISNGNLYIYQTNISSKPSLVCILSAFDQIQIHKNRTMPPIWVFSLKPMIESVPELVFAAPSEREMESWICEIRIGIVHSKNIQLQKYVTKPSRELPFGDMESSIYSTVVEKAQVRDVLLTESQSNIYEEPDEILFRQSSTSPSAPPISPFYPTLSCDTESIFSDILENKESCIFYGSREDAIKELSRCQLLGSYLVRKENERQILTVRCESNFVKYCLQKDLSTNRIYISGQSTSFENLDQLLSYYHEHDIPNQRCKLLLPYKLVNNNNI